ncbi:hypothetical protein KSP39_PZI003836 [Platanthera zijinensis]|uniref:Uncharacterized protein n=1 Tax=Platanthera zijinensis TaxID=2320716 RepID=A0AAP0BUP3_9ASPA
MTYEDQKIYKEIKGMGNKQNNEYRVEGQREVGGLRAWGSRNEERRLEKLTQRQRVVWNGTCEEGMLHEWNTYSHLKISKSGTVADDPTSEVLEDTVPKALTSPTKSVNESEWLRRSLHKWLDEEYCPEPTNFEISRLAAQSYYESLASKETDLGEILLKMARRLETISFQESFHGPYSSANAAVHLITQRIDSTTER